MFHTSIIEISRSALENNIDFLRALVGDKVRISATVKGNAYGHGMAHYVPLAESLGIDHFSVFSAEEAHQILQTKQPASTIMLMGMIADEHLAWAIAKDIEFYVFDQERLNAALEAAKKVKKKARIHLEMETGMNRTGFKEDSLGMLIKTLHKGHKWLEIIGLCTHYAGAESFSNHERVTGQIENFTRMAGFLASKGIEAKTKHTACSAATICYPQTRMDMVRLGIVMYGFWPSREIFSSFSRGQEHDRKDPLKRILTWKSQVMSVKKVKAGEYVGYGSSFQAPRDMLVGLVPVGYAYGFSRNLSNLGRVIVNGKRAAVIGIVNMNLISVDLSENETVKRGEEVVLIGSQGDETVSVASFEELSNQPNYELLTRLPHNIPRVVVD